MNARQLARWATLAALSALAVSVPVRADTVWVEDEVPLGATRHGQCERWTWTESGTPAPRSGRRAHASTLALGLHQHCLVDASETLIVPPGATLFSHVYLDPATPPREVMLQWFDGSWEHRAFWGEDLIGVGASGTAGRWAMGPLPATGRWVRLEVPAALVGLEGRTLTGMAFTLYDGKATWDATGVRHAGAWVDDAVPAGATASGTWGWSPGAPTPWSGASAHTSGLVTGI